MKVGLPVSEVPMFQAYVRETLNTVEQICAQARQRPEQLPSPSRRAYTYLKQLNLDQLPLAHGAVQSPKQLRVTNIRAQERTVQRAIAQAAQSFPVSSRNYRTLASDIAARVEHLESLCSKAEVTPAHLTGIAQPYYRWLRFLQEDRYLKLHLAATHQVIQAIDRLYRFQKKGFNPVEQDKKPAKVTVVFANMSGLFRYRHHSNHSLFEINEGYIAGDADILTALAQVFVSGKQSPATTSLRKFSLHEAFSEIMLALELTVEEIKDTAKGQYFDLNDIYESVHQRYFVDARTTGQTVASQKIGMGKPKLAWSATQTRRKFGHYEPSKDRIVISQTLDSPDIPSYVVEFVMYHELLHQHHGETWVNGKLRIHTPAFRRDERLFEQYQLAQDVLQKLASRR